MGKHIAASPRDLARVGGVLYLITIVVGLQRGVRQGQDCRTRRCHGYRRQPQVDGVSVASRHCWSDDHGHLHRCPDIGPLCFAETGQRGSRLAGDILQFTPEQLNAMASLSLKSRAFGFGIALLFFGPFFLVTGYLIFRSTYFPRAIGILYQIGGVAYLANGFVLLLAPRFAGQIFAIIVLPAFVGEASFCLWLLIKGVNMERWKAQADGQSSRSAAATV
jgi:hypothetical protein